MAARAPAPGGGAVAAVTLAAAAGLVAMAARFDDGRDETAAIVEEADAIRREALRLADEDTVAYAAVLDASRADHDDEAARRRAVRAALSAATDVPLGVVERGHRVATLGVPVALDGNPNLRGDALVGVRLADAAARSAADLVRLNASLGDLGDGPVDQAESWCAELRVVVGALEQPPR